MAKKNEPVSVENERTVLGAILFDDAALHEVMGSLSVEEFHLPKHQRIYSAIQAVYKTAGCADVVLVTEELKNRGHLDDIGGPAYLTELVTEVPTATNVGAYVKIVKMKALARRAQRACVNAYRQMPDDAEKVIEQTISKLTALLDESNGEAVSPITDDLNEALESLAKQIKGDGISGLRTGFRDLDVKTSGFHAGELIVVAAETGVGKTAFAGCVADNVAKTGKNVLIFSAEMTATELIKRMICREAGVSPFSIATGNVYDGRTMYAKQVVPAAAKLDGRPIYIDDSSDSIGEILSRAWHMAVHKKPELVIVDYIQLYGGEKGESREREVASVSRGLKRMANELGVPVMALSQLNDQGKTRESRAIKQDADILMIIKRPMTTERIERANIVISKQRNGPVGSVTLNFNKTVAKFENAERG